MSSYLLRKYLELERQMLLLDSIGDPSADKLRDSMDSVWQKLSDKEQLLLNERAIKEGQEYG